MAKERASGASGSGSSGRANTGAASSGDPSGARPSPAPNVAGDADRSDHSGGGPADAANVPGSATKLEQRLLADLRHDARVGESAGGHVAAELGHAAEAMALEVVPTHLTGERALVGHVLGMHLVLPAGHLHGPRETPALIYLFADALAFRPTGDAPMSTVPIFGLHMVLPPLAIARWVYKAGRMEHANLDLVKDEQRFADSLADWTVDDLAEADPKLEVHHPADIRDPLHVYGHLGYANVWLPVAGGRPVHLKSALPVTSDAFVKLWQLFTLVHWPNGLSTAIPPDVHGVQGGTDDGPEEPSGGGRGAGPAS